MSPTRNWRDRLENYVAGAKANTEQRTISVSREVFEKAKTHQLHVLRTSRTEATVARVKSASSGTVYQVDLWVDEAKIFPTFPYVWKCSCKWGRERFGPCSHVIAVALYRGKEYGETNDGSV